LVTPLLARADTVVSQTPNATRMETSRYDRQLRLWGDEGQARLASARVCAIGATPATCEALKNLILGGIATFTLCDRLEVGSGFDASHEHLAGELFEVTLDDASRRRGEDKCIGQALVEALVALNPKTTKGYYDGACPESKARDSYEEFYKRYDAVIVATDAVSNEALCRLAKTCETNNIPLATARACGLYGEVRTCAGTRWAVERVTPEGSTMMDLRLTSPWSDLSAYVEMKTCDLERLDEAAFKHVPFVALLAHATKQCASRDRRAVRDALATMRRGVDEENFDEAMANARYAWTDTGAVTEEIMRLIDDERARQPSATSDKYWFLVAGLRAFIEREGCLPLEGSIPDMTSTTESYVELQRLYADKAAKDAAAVRRNALDAANRAGVANPEEFIPEGDTNTFCKNCRNVRVLSWRPLEEELLASKETRGFVAESAQSALEDPAKAMSLYIFVAFRARNSFSDDKKRLPGVFTSSTADSVDDLVKEDASVLQTLMMEWFESMGIILTAEQTEMASNVAYETARYGSSQLNPVGAILGGIMSQELIKIITRQYTPMQNRLIYDGVRGTTQQLF